MTQIYEEELREIFISKLHKEYEELYNYMYKVSKEELINNLYSCTWLVNIYDYLLTVDISVEEMEILIQEEGILDLFYRRIMKYMDDPIILEIENVLADLTIDPCKDQLDMEYENEPEKVETTLSI